MPSKRLQHSIDRFSESAKPSFIKQVDGSLAVSLTYINNPDPATASKDTVVNECLISFHNISDKNITINPEESRTSSAPSDDESSRNGNGNVNGSSNSWFGAIFSSTNEATHLMEEEPTPESDDVKIFLGYIQLMGYIVLNYKFGLNTSATSLDLNAKSPHWWANRDYINQYKDTDGEDGQYADEISERLDTVPFVKENLDKPLIVGGKLGGVGDLIVEQAGTTNHWIDRTKLYFVHDLLFPFNSYLPPRFNKASSIQTDIKIPAKELTESIIPFYSTSQSLLFTDLNIEPQSTKTFHIKFPRPTDLPPSYNSRSTGPLCDQGLISIKYSLIVNLSQSSGNQFGSHSVYFPLDIIGERIGVNERWLQRDYFQNKSKIDKDWKVEIIEKEEIVQPQFLGNVSESIETREAFLGDLSKLIESDLYNMPKMSTNERKKSVHTYEPYEEEEQIEGKLVPQLPNHLKTQFQLRVNNSKLCLISLSRPYYHVGDDINFILDINPDENSPTTKIVGFIVHLEAHEIFHCSKVTENPAEKADITNSYRITGSIKYNTYGSSLPNAILPKAEQKSTLINGSINIPKHSSQQFQSSALMDLKYYIVFKFNLNLFIGESKEESNQNSNSANQEVGDTEAEATGLIETETQATNRPRKNKVDDFKFNSSGTELRFRLPIYLLP
ncbi:Rgp1-domain-containing protein [Scheffersomyces xylosifermentans]|uniref:Rgp1-domain-containing protein n=1 Tax=Scheffersomyces xylosifermentans TaxID=1304137 RepID=UPI00315CA035